MELNDCSARVEIGRLLAKYNASGDRGRLEELASVFSKGGILVGRKTWAGRAAIEAGLAAREDGRSLNAIGPDRPFRFVRHHLTTSSIEFQSDVAATGRTYFLAVTDIGLDHSGVYADDFIKEDGSWKIRQRRVLIDWVASNGHTWPTKEPDGNG